MDAGQNSQDGAYERRCTGRLFVRGVRRLSPLLAGGRLVGSSSASYIPQKLLPYAGFSAHSTVCCFFSPANSVESFEFVLVSQPDFLWDLADF